VGLTVNFKNMKDYKVKIKGITPYMQHRMDDLKLEQWEKQRGPIHERPEVNREDAVRAEYHCFRNMDGKCYIPSDHLRGALIGAGSYVKAKVGGRSKSMKVLVAAMFVISPDQILLPDYDAIDKRSAVNRNIKGRVISIRPKWTNWEAELNLNVYESTITNETITQLFEYAGNLVGIGSFRPTNNGLFGRFELTELTEIKP
jgi:hypothetical protein